MGRGILLWLLASQSRLSSFSRSSGTDRIEVAPYVAVIRRTFILPGIGTRPESSRQASGRHVVGREARRTMPSLN